MSTSEHAQPSPSPSSTNPLSLAEVSARFRADFALRDGELLLNSAGVAPMSLRAQHAINRTAAELSEGWFSLTPLFARYGEARATFAKLCGAQPSGVAMFHTCAAALSQVALGLPLRSGDEIVTWDQEYPSNGYPWHAAARRADARVLTVPSEPDFSLDMQRLFDAIGPRTRVAAVSWVQFQTGAITDLKALSEHCHRVGAWLVVDAIQGLGVLPFDLTDLGVDIVCGGTHKWLGGPLGHGFLAMQPQRASDLAPLLHGAMTYGTPDDAVDPQRPAWSDARRFEPGSPLLFGAIGGAAAIEQILTLGPTQLGQAALLLADRLIAGLRERGANVLLPRNQTQRSPIVTFVPRGDVSALAHHLNAHKVAFARRAGGIRLAPHALNTQAELDQFFAIFDAAP
ncbi:MAG TPA: aminotransferase class V-fold PLP-dependent enzyme [Pseudomonadota bacterium]|nr:aminotransferase class V-fold PLP-dependent enzyme [Pseudomonadota bacterium]